MSLSMWPRLRDCPFSRASAWAIQQRIAMQILSSLARTGLTALSTLRCVANRIREVRRSPSWRAFKTMTKVRSGARVIDVGFWGARRTRRTTDAAGLFATCNSLRARPNMLGENLGSESGMMC
jgi:hypothetical protein